MGSLLKVVLGRAGDADRCRTRRCPGKALVLRPLDGAANHLFQDIQIRLAKLGPVGVILAAQGRQGFVQFHGYLTVLEAVIGEVDAIEITESR